MIKVLKKIGLVIYSVAIISFFLYVVFEGMS